MNLPSLQPPAHPACRIPILARHRRRAPAFPLQDVDLTGSSGIRLPTEFAASDPIPLEIKAVVSAQPHQVFKASKNDE
jgi:hypothetical protein